MKKKKQVSGLEFSAFLWDGQNRLPGRLDLGATDLFFHPNHFTKSRLKIQIPFTDIERLETFEVFDFAPHGIRIWSKGGYQDAFVLEEAAAFKRALKARRPIV